MDTHAKYKNQLATVTDVNFTLLKIEFWPSNKFRFNLLDDNLFVDVIKNKFNCPQQNVFPKIQCEELLLN